jgi:hypothetical protein
MRVCKYHDQNALNETIGYHSGYQDTHIVLVRLCKTVLGTLDLLRQCPKAMSMWVPVTRHVPTLLRQCPMPCNPKQQVAFFIPVPPQNNAHKYILNAHN